MLSSVFAPAMGAFGAIMSGAFLQDVAQEATAMQKYGQLLGISTEQMSAWAGMANKMGVQTDQLADIFTDFNDKASDVARNDSGPFKELIERGLVDSFTDANGNLKNTEEIIYDISDAMRKVGPQEGAGLAKRLGINDPKMIALMMQGREEMRKQLEEMRKMGVYTDEDARSAKEFNGQISMMGRQFRMMLIPVFRLAIPLLNGLANAVRFVQRHWVALTPVFTAIAAILIARLIPSIKKTATAIKAAFNWKSFGILTLLLAIGLILEDIIVWANGGKSAFGGLYEKIFGSKEVVKDFIAKLMNIGDYIEPIKQIATVFAIVGAAFTIAAGLAAVFATTVGTIIAVITGVIVAAYLMYANWDSIVGWFSDKWNSLCDSITSVWDSACSTISGIWDAVCNAVSGAWDSVVQTVMAGINWILNKFSMLSQKWDALKAGISSMNPLNWIGGGDGGSVDNSSSSATQNNTYYINGGDPQEVANTVGGVNAGFNTATGSV